MRRWLPLLVLLFLFPSAVSVAQDVRLEASMRGMAVLWVDGARRTLRAGQSCCGLELLSADSEGAWVKIAGERQRLGLSSRVEGSYREPERREVVLRPNGAMQFITYATINGRRVEVMVDTGANIVAMNEGAARRLGVGGDEGVPVTVTTAGEPVAARQVVLGNVSVGGMEVPNVPAAVLPGGNPTTVLLGMSYLRHVDLRHENGTLVLSRDW